MIGGGEGVRAVSRKVQPAIVLLMLGSNDTKAKHWDAEAYAGQLEEMVRGYAGLPSSPQVVLMIPPAAFRNPWGIRGSVIAGEIAPIVRAVAARTGADVVDVHEATKDRPGLFRDGVHPGSAGGRLIAGLAAQAITARGRPPSR